MKQRKDNLTTLAIIVTLMMAVTVAVSAQQTPAPSEQPQIDIDPDSEQFADFADALVEVQGIQQGLSETIDETIEESDMGSSRFQEVHRIMQEPNSSEERERLSEPEREQYATLIQDIQEVQVEAQKRMVATVEDHDLSVERFNNMIRVVQQDEELQAALQQQSEE